MNIDKLALLLLSHFVGFSYQLLTGRYCAYDQAYSAYQSELRTRYVSENYHDDCCEKIVFICVGCDKTRYRYENYYVQVSTTMYREVRSCCLGYYQVGNECVPGTSHWSGWSEWSQCQPVGFLGKRQKTRTRKCIGSICNTGSTVDVSQDCQFSYIGAIMGDNSARGQCASSSCAPFGNVDSLFGLNFFNVDVPEKELKLKITVKTKMATNGQSDINMHPSETVASPTKYNSSMDSITGMSKYEFISSSPLGDCVVDNFETDEYQVGLNAGTTGKVVKFGVWSRVTFNPQPASQTYYSAIFHLHNGTKDEIFVINHKKVTLDTDRTTLNFPQLDFNVSNSWDIIYPGLSLTIKPKIVTTLKYRVYNFTLKIMIPSASVNFDFERRSIFYMNNAYNKSEHWSQVKDYYDSKRKYHLFFEAPYQDSSFGTYSLDTYTVLQNNELVRQTYLSQPVFKSYAELSFCLNSDCSQIKFQSNEVSYEITSRTKIWFRKERFRIKQIKSGNCWTGASDFYIKATSSCRDVFQLLDDSRLQHVSTGMNLRYNSKSREAMVTADGGHRYVLQSNAVVEQQGKSFQKCYYEEDGKIKANSSFEIQTNRVCGDETASRIKILPDLSEYYSKLQMKSVLMATTVDGSIIHVCEPAGDLAVKSNCKYSFDNGLSWTAMTPFVTQIKFYLPAENRYYGYCNKAKFFCYWSPKNPLLEYIDESTFNEKQLDVNAVYATGLDGMTLTETPTETDNDQIGLSSKGIFKIENGSWGVFCAENEGWKNGVLNEPRKEECADRKKTIECVY